VRLETGLYWFLLPPRCGNSDMRGYRADFGFYGLEGCWCLLMPVNATLALFILFSVDILATNDGCYVPVLVLLFCTPCIVLPSFLTMVGFRRICIEGI